MTADHPPRFVWVIGAGFALAAGAFDAGYPVICEGPRAFPTFGGMLASAGATTLAALGLYAASVGALGAWRRPGSGRFEARAVGVASFLGSAFVLGTISGLGSAESPTLPRLVLIVVLAALVGGAAVPLHHLVAERPARRERAAVLAVGVPLVLWELLILIRVQGALVADHGGPFLAIVGPLTIGAILVATLVLLQRRLRPQRAFAWQGGVLAFAALSLMLPLASSWIRPLPAGALASAPLKRPVPRVILLSVDTLRADVLGAYGHSGGLTPHLDALARDSVVFEEAMASSSWTLPSFASIHTGLNPWVHETNSIHSRLPTSIDTLAEHLARSGYHTAAILCNPVLGESTNMLQGFAERRLFPRRPTGPALGSRLVEMGTLRQREWSVADSTAYLTDEALSWLPRNVDRSFFLWFHYFDPHMPYAPPRRHCAGEPLPSIGAAFDRREETRSGKFIPGAAEIEAIRRLYEAEVRYIDEQIGRFVDALKAHDLYDDSLIVFLSDHGEELWDHGGFEHGHALHREIIRVPLMVKLPGRSSTGRVPTRVTATAVTPTILDLCYVEYDRRDFSAPSLRPHWEPESGSVVEAPLISCGCVLYENQIAVFYESWKYAIAESTGRETLHDLSTDLRERHPVTASDHPALTRGRALVEEFRRRDRALQKRLGVHGREERRVDPSVLEQLRTLGYTR